MRFLITERQADPNQVANNDAAQAEAARRAIDYSFNAYDTDGGNTYGAIGQSFDVYER